MQSDSCEMLHIRYPVFQGGMAWIADGKLAAAVSEGGGLGIVASGNAPADYVREQIQITTGVKTAREKHWNGFERLPLCHWLRALLRLEHEQYLMEEYLIRYHSGILQVKDIRAT